jgi:nucleoside-diphosphate-sugar epimerase
MRVAVSGGGGFIGAHLLARLLGMGIDVTLIGEDTGRSRYVAALVADGAARFTNCGPAFRDEAAVRSALADADALVLLGYVAPRASSPTDQLLEELEQNVGSTARILRAAEGRVRHVVFASSDSVYGNPVRTPVRESDAASPRIPLAAAKLACEQMVRISCSAAGASAIILRYSIVYGPGEPCTRAVPTFIRAALSGQPPQIDGEGLDERDYVHVADAVDATMNAIRREADGVYNIGTGIGTTTIELAQLVVWISGGSAAPVRRVAPESGHDRTSVVLDIALAASELGFVPRRSLPDGLAAEIGWFKTDARTEPEWAHLAASA